MSDTQDRTNSELGCQPDSQQQSRLPADYELADRYTADAGMVFLTGIQALARLPLEQLRADRAAGLSHRCVRLRLPGLAARWLRQGRRRGGAHATRAPRRRAGPALNEEYGATAVMGSQLAAARPDARYDGVLGIWYGKAPGVDRASDALRHAVYAGSHPHGGAVALVGDDPAAKSSTLPVVVGRLAVRHAHAAACTRATPARPSGSGATRSRSRAAPACGPALKIVADVADGSGTVELEPDALRPVIPLHDGRPYVHVPDGRLLTPHTLELERRSSRSATSWPSSTPRRTA